ncbi:hypothetical protein LWI28_017803 [Acer negundo]|uniref:TF-B3 domain-containing protein n=1 Tax=Acer negundo TaxID=4023 RepID=A0AAD5IEZ5_ACENE|nr:hypothetical protein LWI28_017803 [Acer negundo]KAK4838833.1 hypothetical protein QYF36_016807 [Acer negundo]
MIPFMNGKHFLDLEAADIWRQKWPLRYYTRPISGNGHVFTIGWRQFVEAKRLQVGDELTFYGNHDQDRDANGEPEMLYMIEVKMASSITFQGNPIITPDVEYLA